MDIKFSGFEWDRGNAEKNLRKHGVTREMAEEAIAGRSFIFADTIHSTEAEARFIVFGETRAGEPLFVAFTLRGDRVRVISARPMSRKERIWYEKEKNETGA